VINELVRLIDSAQPLILLLFAVFLRVGAAVALMPGFGEQSVPLRVRLLLAIVFTAVVWPLAGAYLPAGLTGFTVYFYFSEVVAGLAMGIFFRLFVMVLQLAGMIAAQATSLSQIFGGGSTPDPMPAFGNVLVIGGLALAMMAGLHIQLASALAQSYLVMPLGRLPVAADITEWGVAGVTRSFALAFSLAGPFVIASVVYNLALGAINRAMPQLMVAFVGAPLITLAGLALLAITAPVILTIWLDALSTGLASPFGAQP
jgi:flagellar biosynthesis protein FliR